MRMFTLLILLLISAPFYGQSKPLRNTTQSLGSTSAPRNATLRVQNGLVYADAFFGASVTAKINAAIASLGSRFGIVIIPSTLGSGSPSYVPANVTLWDLRGDSNTLTTNSVSWNAVSPSGLHSMLRVIQTRTSPVSSDLAVYGQSIVGGTLPTGQSLDGISGEVDTSGAITTPGSTTLAGVEGSGVLNSTGGTVSAVYGGVFNISSISGNTTNVRSANVIRAQAYSKSGSETVTDAIGVVADAQTAGSRQNLSLWAAGDSRFDGYVKFGPDGSHLSAYTEGTWTPTPTNLTEVGSPTITGTYTRIGRLVNFTIKIVPGISTASTHNATSFSLPTTPATDAVCGVTSDSVANYGTGWIRAANASVYTPDWSATANTVIISGSYQM